MFDCGRDRGLGTNSSRDADSPCHVQHRTEDDWEHIGEESVDQDTGECRRRVDAGSHQCSGRAGFDHADAAGSRSERGGQVSEVEDSEELGGPEFGADAERT